MQDNVYVIVAYFFFEPVAQLYIWHIQEQNNFIKKGPRNIFCLFFRESWQYLNPLVPSIKKENPLGRPALIFGPVRSKNYIQFQREHCKRFMSVSRCEVKERMLSAANGGVLH